MKYAVLVLENFELDNGLHLDQVNLDVGVFGGNLNTAIMLTDPETGEDVATATVNGSQKLSGRMTLIKDYAENSGMFDWLVAAQIIEPAPELDEESGFVTLRGARIIDHDVLDAVIDLRTEVTGTD